VATVTIGSGEDKVIWRARLSEINDRTVLLESAKGSLHAAKELMMQDDQEGAIWGVFEVLQDLIALLEAADG